VNEVGLAGVVTYNKSLVALLNHYGAIPRACRPYRAKTRYYEDARGLARALFEQVA